MISNRDDKSRLIQKLLEEISEVMSETVAKELSTDRSRELLEYSRLVLDNYSRELGFSTSMRSEYSHEYRALIRDISRSFQNSCGLDEHHDDVMVSQNGEELQAILAEVIYGLTKAVSSHEVESDMDGINIDGIKKLLNRAVKLHLRLKNSSHNEPGSNKKNIAHGSSGEITPESLGSFLRDRFSGMPKQPVIKMDKLVGGHSKTTLLVTLVPNQNIPEHIVIRQDIPLTGLDRLEGPSKVADEYPVLHSLYEKGLPVPKVLAFEDQTSLCGAPFIVMEKIPGRPAGRLSGFFNPGSPDTASATRDLARVLGNLHSVPVKDVYVVKDAASLCTPSQRLHDEITYNWCRWERERITHSPLIESAYALIFLESSSGISETSSIVHGDMGPHNLLIDQGKVTAILDWEYCHAGDPAQDLAYCRALIKQVMPWEEFLELYMAAGGKPVNDHRLFIFELFGLLRNYTFTTTAIRHFVDSSNQGLTNGAAGYFYSIAIENQIASLMSAYTG